MEIIRYKPRSEWDHATAKIVLAAHSYLRDNELIEHGYNPSEIRQTTLTKTDEEIPELKANIPFVLVKSKGLLYPQMEFACTEEAYHITTFNLTGFRLEKLVFRGISYDEYDYEDQFRKGASEDYKEITLLERSDISYYDAFKIAGAGLFYVIGLDWIDILRRF